MDKSDTSVLRDTFGFNSYRRGQKEVVDLLLAGKSALAIFPTGGGKSLCYQLPALILNGLTVVISPLIALMKDQVDALKSSGVAAARLDSSIAYDEVQQIYRSMADGSLKILYIAPERLANERFLVRLRTISIDLLAVDEAHCISEWGHNFRPDYLKIARLAKQLRVGRVLALTATATPQVADDIRKAFAIGAADQVLTGFNRPNLALSITACTAEQRPALLVQRLKALESGATIVYVTLQRTAEEVAKQLVAQGFNAQPYHAGLGAEQRSGVQDAFMDGRCTVIVATIAFGMGIDKADIRTIIHYNLPKTIENYMQEIGRAGRDGLSSFCEMLACSDDYTVLENFSYGDTPTYESLNGMIRHLLSQGQRFDISRYQLSSDYDIRPLVVATVLTYLELNGTLEPSGPFYEGYKFKFNRTAKQICADYDENRRSFLSAVFASAKSGRVWNHLVPEQVAQQIGQPRERITAALTYLEEKGQIVLQSSGLRYGYQLANVPEDLDPLINSMVESFYRQEQQNLRRTEQIRTLVEAKGCIVRHLLNYFGEQLSEDCGQCSRCLAEDYKPVKEPVLKRLTVDDEKMIQQLSAEQHGALQQPRQLGRFLCGISSPATTKAKLTKDHRFGCYAHLPFSQVMVAIENQIGY